jgi:hypothetical protein
MNGRTTLSPLSPGAAFGHYQTRHCQPGSTVLPCVPVNSNSAIELVAYIVFRAIVDKSIESTQNNLVQRKTHTM